MTRLRGLAARGDYREVKSLLARGSSSGLRDAWPGLEAMEKAVLFKLMEPEAAMDFFEGLPFPEKYFLFCAFDPGAIAPVLAALSPRERSLFHRLPRGCYERMFQQLRARA